MSQNETLDLRSTTTQLALDPAEWQRVLSYIKEGTPETTRRSREQARRYFWAWAQAKGLAESESYPIPGAVLASFIRDHDAGLDPDVDQALVDTGVKARLGTLSPATIKQRVSHMRTASRAAAGGHEPDVELVRQALRALDSHADNRPPRPKKRALDLLATEALLSTCRADTKADIRDRALILVGLAAGGRRRSKLAALTVEDLTRHTDGWTWLVRGAKSRRGKPFMVPIMGRAARALEEWLEVAGIISGPIWLGLGRGARNNGPISGQTVRDIIRRRAKAAGFDPDDFSAHSIRAGFLTEASRHAGLPEIMAMSGHRSVQVAAGYIEDRAARDNPAARIFG